MHAIASFLQRKPHRVFSERFDDGSGRAVFAGRWYTEEFDSDEEFVSFLRQFDSVLQPTLHGWEDNHIVDWYVPIDSDDVIVEKAEWQLSDATTFLPNLSLGFMSIPWLSDRDHAETFRSVRNDYPELIGKGPAGYLYIFVANSLE